MEEVAKIKVPPSLWKRDLKQLFQDADPSDLTHDIVFHVGSRTFAAHRFILSASCNTFYQEICVASSSFKYDDRTVNITEVPPDVFELLLEFIYTGTCALLETKFCNWNLTANLHLESRVKSDSFAHVENCDKADATDFNKIANDDVSESSDSAVLRVVQLHAQNLCIRKLAEILEKVN